MTRNRYHYLAVVWAVFIVVGVVAGTLNTAYALLVVPDRLFVSAAELCVVAACGWFVFDYLWARS